MNRNCMTGRPIEGGPISSRRKVKISSPDRIKSAARGLVPDAETSSEAAGASNVPSAARAPFTGAGIGIIPARGSPIDRANRISDWLYLPEILYAFMLVMFVSAGVGPYSLDAAILRAIDRPGAVSFLAAPIPK